MRNPKGIRNQTFSILGIQTYLRQLLKQLQREGKGEGGG
jgi:hypothetical protein